MKRTLIVVDMQNDFVTGHLGTEEARAIVPNIKATYCEINGKPTPIFKNPKDGGFKKSQKGCCVVAAGHDGKLFYVDGRTWEEAIRDSSNLLRPIFRDGELLEEQSLQEIRARLHGGKF